NRQIFSANWTPLSTKNRRSESSRGTPIFGNASQTNRPRERSYASFNIESHETACELELAVEAMRRLKARHIGRTQAAHTCIAGPPSALPITPGLSRASDNKRTGAGGETRPPCAAVPSGSDNCRSID